MDSTKTKMFQDVDKSTGTDSSERDAISRELEAISREKEAILLKLGKAELAIMREQKREITPVARNRRFKESDLMYLLNNSGQN